MGDWVSWRVKTIYCGSLLVQSLLPLPINDLYQSMSDSCSVLGHRGLPGSFRGPRSQSKSSESRRRGLRKGDVQGLRTTVSGQGSPSLTGRGLLFEVPFVGTRSGGPSSTSTGSLPRVEGVDTDEGIWGSGSVVTSQTSDCYGCLTQWSIRSRS